MSAPQNRCTLVRDSGRAWRHTALHLRMSESCSGRDNVSDDVGRITLHLVYHVDGALIQNVTETLGVETCRSGESRACTRASHELCINSPASKPSICNKHIFSSVPSAAGSHGNLYLLPTNSPLYEKVDAKEGSARSGYSHFLGLLRQRSPWGFFKCLSVSWLLFLFFYFLGLSASDCKCSLPQ